MFELDRRGNLQPDVAHDLLWEDFILHFVFNRHRAEIFAEFKLLLDDFLTAGINYSKCWINGSFTSRKIRPGDIDVVFFVNHQIVEEIPEQLNEIAKRYEYVDVYFVWVFPESHRNRFYTKSDELYWLHHFTKRRGKGKKGFVNLIQSINGQPK